MSYISGTYGLKYYKELTNERGVTVRLEIHRRDWVSDPFGPYEIEALNGLTFQVQGAQDDATTPIVKTSLVFGLVDNPFCPGANSNGFIYDATTAKYRRCAKWTEFYTPDSTLYLVKLFYNGNETWRGYITPDSYSESLDSFGTVTITARDNLGHLQDFEFDAEGDEYGLINIKTLIQAAMQKINLPLNLIYTDSRYRELVSEDGNVTAENLCVCVDALEGKDWYSALEEVLNSVGWVIRFSDISGIICGPIRFWGTFGWGEEDDTPSEDAVFLGRGSGTRTYDPAYKEIIEKIDFGQNDKCELNMDKLLAQVSLVNATTDRFIIEYSNDYGSGWQSHMSADHCISNADNTSFYIKQGQFTVVGGYNYLEPSQFSLQDATDESEGEAARNYLFLCANQGYISGSGTSATPVYSNLDHEFRMKVMSPALKFKFEFSEHPMCLYDNKLGTYPYNLKKIIYYVKYVSADGNTTRYWNGYTWIAAQYDFTQSYDPLNETGTSFENEMSACEDCGAYGTLSIVIRRIQYQAVGGVWTASGFSYLIGYGCYARLRSFTIESAAAKVMKSDTIKTVVNDAYNVKYERKPMFGCMPQSVGFAFPTNYLNAFFYYNSDGNPVAAPYNWKWDGESVALPFAVKIHQQILMFHYTTQEVLEGAVRPDNFNRPGYPDERIRYDCTMGYKDKQYFMMSVTHNLLTDRFTSCILRSFTAYGSLWSGTEVQQSTGEISNE